MGIDVDVYQILKDLGAAASSLKDKAAQTRINTLLSELTETIRKKELQIFSLETENLSLKKLKELKFMPGHNYLIDPNDTGRRLCPVCSPEKQTPVPIGKNGYCKICGGYYL